MIWGIVLVMVAMTVFVGRMSFRIGISDGRRAGYQEGMEHGHREGREEVIYERVNEPDKLPPFIRVHGPSRIEIGTASDEQDVLSFRFTLPPNEHISGFELRGVTREAAREIARAIETAVDMTGKEGEQRPTAWARIGLDD